MRFPNFFESGMVSTLPRNLLGEGISPQVLPERKLYKDSPKPEKTLGPPGRPCGPAYCPCVGCYCPFVGPWPCLGLPLLYVVGS